MQHDGSQDRQLAYDRCLPRYRWENRYRTREVPTGTTAGHWQAAASEGVQGGATRSARGTLAASASSWHTVSTSLGWGRTCSFKFVMQLSMSIVTVRMMCSPVCRCTEQLEHNMSSSAGGRLGLGELALAGFLCTSPGPLPVAS
jgi:hypothetical protein